VKENLLLALTDPEMARTLLRRKQSPKDWSLEFVIKHIVNENEMILEPQGRTRWDAKAFCLRGVSTKGRVDGQRLRGGVGWAAVTEAFSSGQLPAGLAFPSSGKERFERIGACPCRISCLNAVNSAVGL
jgi:hypothetical protein